MYRFEATRPFDYKGFLSQVREVMPKGSSEPLFIFDTETTGVTANDCIVEIGCVEMIDGKLTGRNFHRVCKPYAGVKMHPKAAAVHGLSETELKDAMPLEEALIDFVHYMRDAPLYADIPISGENSPLPETAFDSTATLEKKMASMSITKAQKESWETKASANCPSVGIKEADAKPAAFATAASEAPCFDESPQLPQNKSPKKAAPAKRIALCGHNVAFDMRMLVGNAEHLGLHEEASVQRKGSEGRPLGVSFDPTKECTAICTMALFKKSLFPGQSSNTLDACCEFFGVNRNLSAAERSVIGDYRLKENPSQHSALTDAYGTGVLLSKMITYAESFEEKEIKNSD